MNSELLQSKLAALTILIRYGIVRGFGGLPPKKECWGSRRMSTEIEVTSNCLEKIESARYGYYDQKIFDKIKKKFNLKYETIEEYSFQRLIVLRRDIDPAGILKKDQNRDLSLLDRHLAFIYRTEGVESKKNAKSKKDSFEDLLTK